MTTPSSSDASVLERLSNIERHLEAIEHHLRTLRIPLSPLLTLEDAAEALHCSTRTVRRLIDSNRLVGVQMATDEGRKGQWRIQASDLQAMLDRQKTVLEPLRSVAARPKTVIVPNIDLKRRTR